MHKLLTVKKKELKKIIPSDNPKVSIIMTFLNEENNIINALSSIKMQTYKNIEVVVVDDNSTDNSLSLLIDFFKENMDVPVKILKNKINLGTYKSKNLAIKKCTGDFITFLDADDEFLPNKIETELQFLYINKKLVCYSKFKREKERVLFSSPLVHREVFEQIGNFIINPFGSDQEYYERCVKFIPEFIIFVNGEFYKANYVKGKEHLTDKYKWNIRKSFIQSFRKLHTHAVNKNPNLFFDYKMIL